MKSRIKRSNETSVRHSAQHNETVLYFKHDLPDTWICSPKDRMTILHHSCHRNRHSFLNSEIQFGSQFIVDDERKLIYCQVPHIGTHSLKSLLISANNKTKKGKKRKPDTPMGKWSHGLETLGLTHMARLLPRYSNYTKFLVVRNPYDRVISLYNSVKQYSHKIQPAAKDYLKAIYNAGPHLGGLTFENFVHFLTDKSSPPNIYNNPHWKSITDTCFPCHIKYNRVVKLETIQSSQDTRFLRELDLLSPNKVPHLRQNINKSNYNLGGSKSLQQFSSISSESVEKLKNRYRLDMEIFGYSFDLEQNIALCSRAVSIKTKRKCC